MEYLTQKTWSLKDTIRPIITEHLPCAKPLGIPKGSISIRDTWGSHRALSPSAPTTRPGAAQRGAGGRRGVWSRKRSVLGNLTALLFHNGPPSMSLIRLPVCTCGRGIHNDSAQRHPYFSAFMSLCLGVENHSNASSSTKS